MNKIKDVTGRIQHINGMKEFPREVKTGKNKGNKFTKYKIGIKMNDEWWNISETDNKKAEDILGDVGASDNVKIYLEWDGGNGQYWKITQIEEIEEPVEAIITDEKGKEAVKERNKRDDNSVKEFKSKESDKYEYGMAIKNASIIIAGMLNSTCFEVNKKTLKENLPFFETLTESLFVRGKKVRERLIGY